MAGADGDILIHFWVKWEKQKRFAKIASVCSLCAGRERARLRQSTKAGASEQVEWKKEGITPLSDEF